MLVVFVGSGILLDVCFDDKCDIYRESFLVEVKNGKQEVTAMLPMLNKRELRLVLHSPL